MLDRHVQHKISQPNTTPMTQVVLRTDGYVKPGCLILFLVTEALRARLYIAVSPQYYLPSLAVVLGWLILVLDMPIYMLFEGRSFLASSRPRILSMS